MQSCRCHSLAASRPCCQFRIYLIQFQCNMSCQRPRQFISCCFIWLYLIGKYISETLMSCLFFLEHSCKVEYVTQVKRLSLQLFKWQTGSFAKFLGFCGLVNFWIIAWEQITNCTPVLCICQLFRKQTKMPLIRVDSHDTTNMLICLRDGCG